MRSDAPLKRWFNLINKKFFYGELPSNTCVRYVDDDDKDEEENCEANFYGWADRGDERHKYVIVLSRLKNPGLTAKLATLVHEMCHLSTDLKDSHGPAFEAKRQMISDRGVFKKGAVMKNLTIF